MTAKKERIIKPDNLVLENSTSIFHLVMPLISGDKGASVSQDLRAKFTRGFDDFERRCYEMKLDAGRVSDAKYAIAAFVDEKVMGSAWQHKLTWMGKPLQLEYFGDNLAGEGFFQKLAKLRQSGDRNVDVLEIYYLCLQLGFEGMYRMRGLEQLQALQVDLRTQIADSRNRVPRTLSPHGISVTFMEKVQREVPYWAIAAVTIFLIFLAYISYVILLGNKAEGLRAGLRDDGQRIQANLEREATQKAPSKLMKPIEEPKVVPPPKPKVEKPRKKHKPVVVPVTPKAPVPPKIEVAPPPPPPPVKPAPKPEPKPKVITPIMGF